MKPYRYSTLEKSQIRLFHLSLTNKGNLKATVELVHLYPDTDVVYNVFSHAWDGDEPTVNLVCEGKWISITKNLARGLIEYLKLYPNEPLWIDRISIDQEDPVEKSEQVKKMNPIIENSKIVIAWLGASDETTPMALDIISRVAKIAIPMTASAKKLKAQEKINDRKLSRKIDAEMTSIVFEFATWLHMNEESEDDNDREDLKIHEDITIEESENLGISFEDIESWEAFAEFYNSPWFTDIWTLQHIFPARQVTLLRGSHSISWEFAKSAAIWYVYKADEIKNQFNSTLLGVTFAAEMDLDWSTRTGHDFYPELFGMRTKNSYGWCFTRLIKQFHHRSCLDDRDRVYALVNISDLALGGRPDHARVDIDYAKSLKEVYTDAARAIVCHGSAIYVGELDIIMNSRWRNDDEGWPSWVPDLRIKVDGFGCGLDVGIPLPRIEDYKKKRSFRYVKTDNVFSLIVQGVMIGTATYVSPYNHASQLISNENLRITRDKILELMSSYPTGEDVSSAYALTLMAGKIPDAMLDYGTTAEMYAKSFIGWIEALSMPTENEEQENQKEKELRTFVDKGFDKDLETELSSRYCERRLYCTDSGYMGIGNQYMRKGDVIATMIGVSGLCVLRPLSENVGNGYAFVGEAYCHGIANFHSMKNFPCADDGFPITQNILLR